MEAIPKNGTAASVRTLILSRGSESVRTNQNSPRRAPLLSGRTRRLGTYARKDNKGGSCGATAFHGDDEPLFSAVGQARSLFANDREAHCLSAADRQNFVGFHLEGVSVRVCEHTMV